MTSGLAEERVGGMRASAASICLLLPLGKKNIPGRKDRGQEGRRTEREREREVEGKRRLGWGEMMVEVARSCREQRASRSSEGG